MRVFQIMAELLLLLCISVRTAVGEEYYTPQEKKLIEEFKAAVMPKIPTSSYLQNYRNDDLYFLRWLQAQGMRIGAAEKAFLKHLKWREAERMDTILDEDWSQYQQEFRIFVDTVDKTGRPTAELWLSDWNVRKAVASGKAKQLEMWMMRMMELQARQLYASRARGSSNATDLNLLVDTKGFGIFQHACGFCLPVYAHVITMLETHYTGMYKNMIITDVPFAFGILWNVISPLMSGQTRQNVKMYSKQSEWSPVLDSMFDKEQRSIRFGGTLTRNVLFEEHVA